MRNETAPRLLIWRLRDAMRCALSRAVWRRCDPAEIAAFQREGVQRKRLVSGCSPPILSLRKGRNHPVLAILMTTACTRNTSDYRQRLWRMM